ncbi:L-aminoadipate-semialdehyde dehydrogenase-phosphopantetheinyl transferase isoform X2 [Engraulis encrasicolus]|uniref:L-aminoadipate-semialdehyde dehydrogenase-phosphopantetheinyl transferase isoform X2 n=1 Tax=Engraulis encrasicolus TaxID=184585 RepID=UPI002FCEEDAE
MEGVRWAFRCGSWSPTRAEWLLAARCVQREEKERIGQFVFAKDAKSAMAGRLLIRKLVSEKMGIVWDQIRLERTARGKPIVANPTAAAADAGHQRWSFNVSHQGDYAVLAAAPGQQVGTDVMKTARPGSSSIPEFFRLMTRQFTEHEWSTIRTPCSEWDQLHMFYRHWALKESFIKAIGTGLGFDLQRIEFHISPLLIQEGRVYSETRMHLDGEEDQDWTFEEPKPPVQPASAPPRFTLLSFSELVSGALPLTEEDPAYWESFQKKQEAPKRQTDQS